MLRARFVGAVIAYALGEVVGDVVEKVAGEELDGELRISQARVVTAPVVNGELGQAVGQAVGSPPQLLRNLPRLLVPVTPTGLGVIRE
ncbi:hypothetical protein [Streptomyces sp. NPDC058330]|uniref:hypothetical protein n=1 Tax=Streptomyces sp. NPDC058330 TaxID=3346449 RepID=UPI0036EEB683